MSLISHFLQRRLKLAAPLTRQISVERDLRVPMPDGVELLADRWAPRSGGERLPTLLIRSPYGRSGPFGTMMARPFAERGYQVLIQSTRGGFGSGGTFDPFRQERDDGLATLDWVIKQPWFGDAIVLYGPSYMGYVQWALTDALPQQVKAIVPLVTESALTLEFLRPDGFSLETPFEWGVEVATMERPFAMVRRRMQARKTRKALHTLPLSAAASAALGHDSDYIRDILLHDRDDLSWADCDHRKRVEHLTVPASLYGGWHDIFLPGLLRDFQTLQDAHREASLTIGPWTHTQFTDIDLNEIIEFGLAAARGAHAARRAPVRLYVTGQETWRDFETWPPKGYAAQHFYLQGGGALSAQPPRHAVPDQYRYDPADPTPAVGGVRTYYGGRVDNRALESRRDVLVYTTELLLDDVEVIGEVKAEIWFRSSLPHADVFVRLCDVDEHGQSYNVCDGLVSLSSADEQTCASVSLWPTAHRFKRGHRIRVQVSSGAFPRYARNPGTGEPLAAATTLIPAEQQIYHEPTLASAIILPVRTHDNAIAP